jgi:putative DNA primase/helicase
VTTLDVALGYADRRGWPVFPCRWDGPARKRPLTRNGFHDATTNPETIIRWWRQWPLALVSVPTGVRTGIAVLDIDVMDDLANGWDTLEDLGHSVLLDSPVAHTPSGGCHWYFANPERDLRCSAGLLGPGLDVRANGGSIILPSPGSDYEWDPIANFETMPLAPAPDWLWPPRPARTSLAKAPLKPVRGLSPYGTATIEAACKAIVSAPKGEQGARP